MSFTLNRKAKQFYKLIASSEKEFADPTEEVSEKIRDYYLDQAYDYLKDKDPSIKTAYNVYHNLLYCGMCFSPAEENAFAEASLNDFRHFLAESAATSIGKYINKLSDHWKFYEYYMFLDGEGSVSEYGLDAEKIRKTGPDAYTLITIIANSLLPEGEIFRPDQPQTTKFGKRMMAAAIRLEANEKLLIKHSYDQMIEEGLIKHYPAFIVEIINGTGAPSFSRRSFSGASVSSNNSGDPSAHAFVFICRGPDASGFTNILESFHMTSNGIPEAMRSVGFTGPDRNIHMYGPDWNRTIYSSSKVSMPGEADDLIGKIKDCLQKEGFSYNGESIRTAVYSPETSYAQMGLFMTYMLITR